MKTTQLKVDGMTCGGCAGSTQRALQAVPGVRAVKVDLPGGRASVEHTDEVMDRQLVEAVVGAGFEAEVERS